MEYEVVKNLNSFSYCPLASRFKDTRTRLTSLSRGTQHWNPLEREATSFNLFKIATSCYQN